MRCRRPFVIATLVLSTLVLAPVLAFAEIFGDVYGGVAMPMDTQATFDGVRLGENHPSCVSPVTACCPPRPAGRRSSVLPPFPLARSCTPRRPLAWISTRAVKGALFLPVQVRPGELSVHHSSYRGDWKGNHLVGAHGTMAHPGWVRKPTGRSSPVSGVKVLHKTLPPHPGVASPGQPSVWVMSLLPSPNITSAH